MKTERKIYYVWKLIDSTILCVQELSIGCMIIVDQTTIDRTTIRATMLMLIR